MARGNTKGWSSPQTRGVGGDKTAPLEKSRSAPPGSRKRPYWRRGCEPAVWADLGLSRIGGAARRHRNLDWRTRV